jgi:hypothetical protein
MTDPAYAEAPMSPVLDYPEDAPVAVPAAHRATVLMMGIGLTTLALTGAVALAHQGGNTVVAGSPVPGYTPPSVSQVFLKKKLDVTTARNPEQAFLGALRAEPISGDPAALLSAGRQACVALVSGDSLHAAITVVQESGAVFNEEDAVVVTVTAIQRLCPQHMPR